MTAASVGFHCPECLRSGSQKVVTSRTLSQAPVLGRISAGVLVAIFVAEVLYSHGLSVGKAVSQFGVDRYSVAAGEWWRMLTSGFIHLDVLHLAFNAYFFYILAGMLERACGRFAAVACIFTGVAGGSVAIILGSRPAAGASGAGFAMMGVLLVYQLLNGINVRSSGLGQLIALNFFLSLVFRGYVSWEGHLGGFLAGCLCGVILFAAPKISLSMKWRAGIVASLGVFLLGVGALLANLLVGYTN